MPMMRKTAPTKKEARLSVGMPPNAKLRMSTNAVIGMTATAASFSVSANFFILPIVTPAPSTGAHAARLRSLGAACLPAPDPILTPYH